MTLEQDCFIQLGERASLFPLQEIGVMRQRFCSSVHLIAAHVFFFIVKERVFVKADYFLSMILFTLVSCIF